MGKSRSKSESKSSSEIKSEASDVSFESVGRAIAAGARVVGRKTLELYRSIDPDVTRHLLQMPLLTYSLLGSGPRKVEALEPDGHRPLIFVHGLGGTRGDFLPMSGYFWLQGRKRTYRIRFQRGHGIPEMARALARFVRQVMRATGERKVDLVAHSLGGVVARLAVVEHGLARNVATLITLGSPHEGTHAARYANTVTTHSLRPGSPLMKKLQRSRWPTNLRAVGFWSRGDLLILPAESAKPRGMKAVDMTPFTHYSYLIDPRSWSAVFKELARSDRGPLPGA